MDHTPGPHEGPNPPAPHRPHESIADIPHTAARPLSVTELFRIGIGPSSSHTVGPMKAALAFTRRLLSSPDAARTAAVRVELFGSLGATGRGHATDRAVTWGLAGYHPRTIPAGQAAAIFEAACAAGTLELGAGLGGRAVRVAFHPGEHIVFLPRVRREHPNCLRFTALDGAAAHLLEATYFSVGGGFVHEAVGEGEVPLREAGDDEREVGPAPYPFSSGEELLAVAERAGLSIGQVVRANELSAWQEAELDAELDAIVEAMNGCIDAGLAGSGELPGGLKVPRRAGRLYAELLSRSGSAQADPLDVMDWVNLYALAVNEENASGHRVVTAPTNGAAGVVPAVLRYYLDFRGGTAQGARTFLLAACAIGTIIKLNASIAGAEVGCQGEVGSAAAMAAAGLAEVMGGSPRQVENAAEIAMEHNLGLTCDPIGGLVQIPCIERNALAAVKAINAARIALWGDGTHAVSLDAVIETMRQTGADMLSKYKETAEGGLAVNVIEC